MSDGYHLLLVEDEPVTRRRMAEYFRNEGFVVSEASQGAEMHRMLGERRVDLVLLDINLPGEDGLSLARKLRVNDDVASDTIPNFVTCKYHLRIPSLERTIVGGN